MPDTLKLINMEDVQAQEIEWLWKPYIPFGKTTMLQGDPGDGKTTLILAVAAAVTRGLLLPECDEPVGPFNVLYQTAEDGLGDTIKPRLEQSGADCKRVNVIDESREPLTLSDARIEQAIRDTGARLFILDPLQAYLGANVDMHRANEVRPVLKHLGGVAERTNCAIVIIGHMNKGGGFKSQYRGLGSIDIQAAMRSVLTLGRIQGKPHMRAFAQGKSNLAPEGAAIAFDLDPDTGFRWVGEYPITIDELLQGALVDREIPFDRAQGLLKAELTGKTLPASALVALAKEQDISKRTLDRAKSALSVKSVKKDGQWYWTLSQDKA